MGIDTVHLEHVLGQIKADRRNLHGGRSFRVEWLQTLPLWHFDAVLGWGRPSHCIHSTNRHSNTGALPLGGSG
jgi:hypothetical protein